MAQYTAKWGSKGFIVGPGKVVPLSNLSTSVELKSESNNDTSGTPPTNTRGRELQTITLETTYLAAAGVDPRGQIEEWQSLIGEKNSLYIQGRRFGPKQMQLTRVDVSNVVFSNGGAFLSADVAITLVEYVPPNTAVSAKSGGSAYKSSTSTKKASTSSGSKSGALAAKPSTDDKAKKKAPLTGRLVSYALNKGLEMAGIKK